MIPEIVGVALALFSLVCGGVLGALLMHVHWKKTEKKIRELSEKQTGEIERLRTNILSQLPDVDVRIAAEPTDHWWYQEHHLSVFFAKQTLFQLWLDLRSEAEGLKVLTERYPLRIDQDEGGKPALYPPIKRNDVVWNLIDMIKLDLKNLQKHTIEAAPEQQDETA